MNLQFPTESLCRRTAAFFLAIGLLLAGSVPVRATVEYAQSTGQPCRACHLSEQGGGGLNPSGEAFSEDPEAWRPPTVRTRPAEPASTVRRLVRLLILYVHIFFGVVWVGTILYVHLVLKPQYAIGGLPKSELRLAWLSMPAIAVSGAVLSWMRLSSSPGLLATRYGTILMVKAGIFLAMLLSATFVTLFIGPRLRRIVESHRQIPAVGPDQRMTAEQLEAFDGKEGRQTFVAVEGVVYDLSASRLWREGRHAGRHNAGRDMTDALVQAPHGKDVLGRFPSAGRIAGEEPTTPLVVRVFVANAYFNLAGCFAIILCLALWRL